MNAFFGRYIYNPTALLLTCVVVSACISGMILIDHTPKNVTAGKSAEVKISFMAPGSYSGIGFGDVVMHCFVDDKNIADVEMAEIYSSYEKVTFSASLPALTIESRGMTLAYYFTYRSVFTNYRFPNDKSFIAVNIE